MKRRAKSICWIILVGVIGILSLRSCQRDGWERSLLGPYTGVQFTNEITRAPVSTLSIPSRGQLEVYELASEIGPVLVLKSKDGAVQWSRLLVPERRLDNGPVERAWVRELRLEKLERDRNGYEILFLCDWEWGGKEAGLIDLDRNYEFKNFRLSW